MLPEPPRPVENLWPAVPWEGWEDVEWMDSARRVVEVRVDGGGGRVALPAPPRPKVILVEAVGWGSVRRMGITSNPVRMWLLRSVIFYR